MCYYIGFVTRDISVVFMVNFQAISFLSRNSRLEAIFK